MKKYTELNRKIGRNTKISFIRKEIYFLLSQFSDDNVTVRLNRDLILETLVCCLPNCAAVGLTVDTRTDHSSAGLDMFLLFEQNVISNLKFETSVVKVLVFSLQPSLNHFLVL